RLIPQPGADGVTQIAELKAPRVRPDVAAIQEQHAAEVSADWRTQFGRQREHAVAANRQSRLAERTHVVPAPAANRRRTAEEVLSRERDVRLLQVRGSDVRRLDAVGP